MVSTTKYVFEVEISRKASLIPQQREKLHIDTIKKIRAATIFTLDKQSSVLEKSN